MTFCACVAVTPSRSWIGLVAEWLRRGLQILVRGFDSLRGLQAIPTEELPQMPFDSPKDPKPKRPPPRARIFLWPAAAYFVIAVLAGAIVARLTHLWELGRFWGHGHF